MGYWKLVDPIWEKVSIYDGPIVFLEKFAAAPVVPRTLLAAHWCQSEINNGGFEQFFSNPTGVLAPEGVESFLKLNMPQVSATIQEAVSLFGPQYPRDWEKRVQALKKILRAQSKGNVPSFEALEERFYALIEQENGGFEHLADAYASANG